MTVIIKCLLFLLASFAGDLRVYFFTMQSCPPCRQMEPVVDRLAREGYPIQKVDVRANQQLARQFQITSTPTTVIVENQQIVGRQSGLIGYLPLRRRLDQLQANAGTNHPATQQPSTASSSQPLRAHHETRTGNARAAAAPAQTGRQVNQRSGSSGQAELQARRASVRLRVVDSKGTSYATGTVIHVHDKDALIVTCGHVFRESKGQGNIQVDVGFGQGQTNTVPGHLIDYDADARDVALITCKPGVPIDPVPLAPPNLQLQSQAPVFSLGCDSGQAPSIRRSRLKKITRYDGVNKYDVVGRPVNGRSGGGLFTRDGKLIGVCNAAAVNIDEGIYTGISTIYWQLNRVRLAHLFQPGENSRPNRSVAINANAGNPGNSRRNASNSDSNSDTNRPARTPDRSMDPRRGPAQQVATNAGRSHQPGRGQYTANGSIAKNGQREIIFFVRDKTNPQNSKTYTIEQPSAELLQMIRVAGNDALNGQRQASANRSFPDLPANTALNKDTMRAQSPK